MTRQYQGVALLIGWKFSSTNQRHCPDMGSDASLRAEITFLVCEQTPYPIMVLYSVDLGRFSFVRTGRPDHCPTESVWKWNRLFPRVFAGKPSPRAYYLGFDWSGWKVFIKSELSCHCDTYGLVGQFWPMESASSLRLCPLRTQNSSRSVLHYHSPFTAAPSPQGKIRFSNCFSLLERFYGLRRLNMLKSS